MKYNDAIDMILDGGKAYTRQTPVYKYMFNKYGLLCQSLDDDNYVAKCAFDKEDFTDNDWIVEKDGVVYEEYPGMVISREMIVDAWKRNIPDGFVKVTLYSPPVELRKIPMTESGYKKLDALLESGDLLIDERGTPLERVREVKILKSRTNKQDEPAELEEGGEHWMSTEEIREALEAQFPPKPIIADEVNENWLEKKMLCFMNKHLYIHSGMNLEIKQGQCSNRACPFCFPQEQHNPDHIVDAQFLEDHVGKMPENGHSGVVREKVAVETCSVCGESEKLKKCRYKIAGIVFCEDCKRNSPEIDSQMSEPHKKITVDEMMKLIQDYCYDFYQDFDSENYLLNKNLTYLVSLQEK